MLLELTVIVQAVVELVGLGGGRNVAEPVVHLAYLLTSVVLTPLVLALTHLPWHDSPSPGVGSAVIVVACVALTVVQVRLISTGAPVLFAGSPP